MRGRTWIKEDTEYLLEKWGIISIKGLSQKLNRTETAVIEKAYRLGLPDYKTSGEYITLNQIMLALFGHQTSSYIITSWVSRRKMPVKYIEVREQKVKAIKIDDFWKWAEKNKTFIEWDKTEKNCLGKEPEWVNEQRKLKSLARSTHIKRRGVPWTKTEDSRLKYLLTKNFNCKKIAKELQRTEAAVIRRISTLKLIMRPVRVPAHNRWERIELQMAKEMIIAGMPYCLIAEKVNKTEKAVRGKAYCLFGTECQDKIIARNMERKEA